MTLQLHPLEQIEHNLDSERSLMAVPSVSGLMVYSASGLMAYSANGLMGLSASGLMAV